MGSRSGKEVKRFEHLVERPLSKAAYVMIGKQTDLRNYRGAPQEMTIRMTKMSCAKCGKHFDTDSIWFFLDRETSACFSCYVRKRVPFLLLHRFLSYQILTALPLEVAQCVVEDGPIMKDNILILLNAKYDAITLNPLCYLFPHLQYDIVKHIDTNFTNMYCVCYSFCDINNNGKTTRLRVDFRNNAFYIYYVPRGEKEFSLYLKTTDSLVMLCNLDELIKHYLILFEYSTYYKTAPTSNGHVGLPFI